MMAILAILGIITIFVIIFTAKGVMIVEQAEAVVIERLGQYSKTLHSGVNIVFPLIDKAKEIEWRYIEEMPDGTSAYQKRKITRIDLREKVYDFPKQNVITRDNVFTEINALLFFQITDPVKAVYEISNVPDAIEKLTQTTLRNVVGELDLDALFASRDTINMKLRKILDEATDKWGVKINRVELQEINPPAEIRGAMEKQIRAKQDKTAAILEAEGQKKSKILEAEGYKEASIRRAEGERQSKILLAEGAAVARMRVAQAEAEAINKVTNAFKSINGDPANYLIAISYIEALREMVSGKNNKVIYMPYEATGILSSIGGIKELLGDAKMRARGSE
ncbi:MAG: SPFH/Band 7/PHB domain protein [Calditrichaeota bacterium]|nr:SPFH/Band 7/PHB domain protein [Calditrichota bacterium]